MAIPVYAAETPKDHPPKASPYKLDEYSRDKSSVTITFTGEQGGSATAKVYCGAPIGGKWSSVDKDVTGVCYNFNFCYDVPTRDVASIKATHLAGKTITSQTIKANTNGEVTNLCYQVMKKATAADVAADDYSKCTSANMLSPKEKQLCAFDEQTPSQISANTGDDMFKMLSANGYTSNGAFMEYGKIPMGDNSKLKWVERESGYNPNGTVMIPSGPESSLADYKDFVRKPPTGVVSTESACFPAQFSLCAGSPPPSPEPPVNGLCGSANGGTYKDIASIHASARCYVGIPTAITQSGNKFVWSCKGIPSSEKTDSCSATKQSEDIVRPEPPPVGETAPPSNYCFFHVSGMLIGKDPVPFWFSQIGVTDFASNMVGPGEYARSQPFANADAFTFDGIAIGRDTTVTIYSKPNFQGSIILNQKGPAVINNRIWASSPQAQNGWQTSTWPGEFHGQFPPSSRRYSSSDMHAWGHGTSVKVTCSMPGSCASYDGEYTSQPATNTANACGAGSYSDLSDTDTSYRWACTGTDGIARTCAATKKIVLNSGECKGYTGEFSTQPASNAASGCAVGSYKDLGDTETAFRWACTGTDKIDRTCSVKKKVVVTTPGVCAVFEGSYSAQPANSGNGCTSGSYRNIADSDAAYHWGCIGTDDVEQVCGARKKQLVCTYDSNNKIIDRADYCRGGGGRPKKGVAAMSVASAI
ncbi:hypothetical protein A11S_821 [Micavibrio aeruginosavorus EPB]|uniref:Uncharacterized protein n=2 Tax=Micavibrio aeruginosavorus TaxID=349221 RepID=M4VWS2_9BACT|nr:hypothetical protein A11S_821 [Micavibrio aeruginosavorus EPB]